MKTDIKQDRLIACREQMGITQSEAAKMIGVSQPAYQRYEAGLRTPSIQITKEIAKAFNVSVSYLTGESDKDLPDFIVVDKNDTPLLFSVVDKCKDYDEKQLKKLLDYFNKIS